MASSFGPWAGPSPSTSDIWDAISIRDKSSYIGRDPDTGERIMADSCPKIYSNGEVIGVLRYVTSSRLVNRQIILVCLVCCFVLTVVLAVVLLISGYCIRSILNPVAEITEKAQRIASGSYGVQIQTPFKDEIGDLADTINEMSTKIAQNEKMQAEFVSQLSHELRTPLTAIRGWGETLLSDDALDPETRRKGMQVVMGETERLSQMTKTLLEMSNLQQVERNESIQLAPMVEEIFTDLTPLAEKSGITLELAGDGVMTGSDALIYRMIFNLTENAIKYNRPDGSVQVCITQEPEKLLILVSDTGRGIPEEYQQSIFQPFFRVDKSRSRTFGGAGLGLALVWEIAALHGGSVRVAESSDSGTTIAAELPRSGNHAAAPKNETL